MRSILVAPNFCETHQQPAGTGLDRKLIVSSRNYASGVPTSMPTRALGMYMCTAAVLVGALL